MDDNPSTFAARHAAAAILSFFLSCLPFGCAATPAVDWKARANAGIEQHRKRSADVIVADAAGKPVSGANLQIRQTKKAFPFGSAISARMLNTPRWQEEFKKHFTWAVFENESKWTSNERASGRVNYQQADAMLRWCDANNILVRGHCVFWEHSGDAQAWPTWLDNLPPPEFQQALERRITGAMTHFQGHFQTWDVDNEMLHGTYFVDHTGGPQGTGQDTRAWMYKRARALDPNVKLFTNEYNVLSIDKNWQQVQTDAYVAQVRELIRQGAPIDGVGIQGHLWKEDVLAHPEVIRQRLDKIAALGLPIWISEFDVADPDDKVRADKLELVYRTAYSHPAVQGIMMWVFWAGNSWRGPDAALMNLDWTPNEEGKRFESLMAEWTTSVDVQTDTTGHAHFRGFHGDYAVTVNLPGQTTVTQTFTLEPGPAAKPITLTVH